MSVTRYSFIIMAPGYSAANQIAELSSPAFHSTIVGVENVDGAIAAVGDLLEAGVEIIELCGGFSKEEAWRIQERAGSAVAVGRVAYAD